MKCYLTGNEITTSNTKTDEHILPNALGGHLKSKKVLTDYGNDKLNNLIDIPFNKIFEPIHRRLFLKKDRKSSIGVKGVNIQFKKKVVLKEDRCFPHQPFYDEKKNILYIDKKKMPEAF